MISSAPVLFLSLVLILYQAYVSSYGNLCILKRSGYGVFLCRKILRGSLRDRPWNLTVYDPGVVEPLSSVKKHNCTFFFFSNCGHHRCVMFNLLLGWKIMLLLFHLVEAGSEFSGNVNSVAYLIRSRISHWPQNKCVSCQGMTQVSVPWSREFFKSGWINFGQIIHGFLVFATNCPELKVKINLCGCGTGTRWVIPCPWTESALSIAHKDDIFFTCVI